MFTNNDISLFNHLYSRSMKGHIYWLQHNHALTRRDIFLGYMQWLSFGFIIGVTNLKRLLIIWYELLLFGCENTKKLHFLT